MVLWDRLLFGKRDSSLTVLLEVSLTANRVAVGLSPLVLILLETNRAVVELILLAPCLFSNDVVSVASDRF